MFFYNEIVLCIGLAVAFLASRRLEGEARIFGAYFTGLAAAVLIAIVNFVSLDVVQGPERAALLTYLVELAGLGPFLGIVIGGFLPKRSLQNPRYGVPHSLTTGLS